MRFRREVQSPQPWTFRNPPRLSQLGQVSWEGVSHVGQWKLGQELNRGNNGKSSIIEVYGGGGKVNRVLKAYPADYPQDFFDNEVTVHSRLRHPNIVRYREHGQTETIKYIVMDRINGKPVIRSNVLPVQNAASVTGQIGEALGAVHKKGFVHADVTPSNILLEDDGNKSWLIDFGLAGRSPIIDWGNFFWGTPRYCAPEQFHHKTHQESDTYALALTLFYMLTSEHLWNISLEEQIKLLGIIPDHDNFVRSRVDSLAHKELHEPLRRALAYRANGRHETVVDFAADVSSRVA